MADPDCSASPQATPTDRRPDNHLIVDYWLGPGNTIIHVGGAWDAFAAANDGLSLVGTAVVGRPLRDYVTGDITRMFVEVMINKVRISGQLQSVPYRCDSPGVKRFMQMDLIPQKSDLLCRHRLLREERLTPPVRFTFAAGRLDHVVKRCSMCNRLTRRDGKLVEPDTPEARELSGSHTDGIFVIYHVCAECRGRVAENRS